MSDTARDIQTVETISTDGMDDLYSQVENQQESPDSRLVLTVAEASARLGIPISTMYRRIRAGKFNTTHGEDGAVRIVIEQGNLPENHVVTAFGVVENQIDALNATDSLVSPNENQHLQVSQNSDLMALLRLMAEKDKKLEAANFRLGYLESQLEGKDREIKLLTDSQPKPTFWQLLKAFFVKG